MMGPGMVPSIFSATICTANPKATSWGSTDSVIMFKDGFVVKKNRIIVMERVMRKKNKLLQSAMQAPFLAVVSSPSMQEQSV
jgi:hypothetical protein